MLPTWAAVRLVPTAVDLGDATGDNVSYLGGRSSGSDPRSSGSDPRPSGHGDRRPCVLLEQPFVSLRWQSIWPLRWPTWAAVRPAFTAVHVVVVVLLERLVVWLRPPFIWPRPQATMRPTWAAVRLVPTAVHLGVATSDHMSYLGGRSSGSDFRPSGYEDRCPCVLFERPFVWL